MQSHLVCEVVCPVTSLAIRRHRIIIPHRGEPALAVVPGWEKTRYQITALPSPPTWLPVLKITFGVFCPSPAWGGDSTKFLTGPPAQAPVPCRRRCEGVCERAGRRARGGRTASWVLHLRLGEGKPYQGGLAVPQQSHPAPRPTFGPCRLEGTLSPRCCLQRGGS